MNTTSMAIVKFSVEVITLPVSDVDRALRFYVDQVGFTLAERTWVVPDFCGACCRRAPRFRAERKSHTRARDRGRLATIVCHATLPHA